MKRRSNTSLSSRSRLPGVALFQCFNCFSDILQTLGYFRRIVVPVVFIFGKYGSFEPLPFKLLQDSFDVWNPGSPGYVMRTRWLGACAGLLLARLSRQWCAELKGKVFGAGFFMQILHM